MPVVDFPNELVVYVRNVDSFNHIDQLAVSLDEQGVADLEALTTLTNAPIEDFVYWSAATIPTDGVLQLGSSGQFVPVQVPEPSGISLAAIAGLGLAACRHWRG